MKVLSLSIKKIILCAAVTAVITAPSAYANIDSCDYDRDTNTAQVSGLAKADTAVSLRIMRDNNIIYEDQVNSDADGNYTHTFKISGQPGDYLVTVGEAGVKKPYETTLRYYGDIRGLLGEINKISQSGSDRDMKEKLLSNLNELFGADEELKNTLNDDAADHTIVYKKLADGTVYSSVSQLKTKTEQLLALHRIYTASDTETFLAVCENEKKPLSLESDTAYETLVDKSMLSAAVKDEICAVIYGRDYKDINEFKSHFCDRVLTYAVKRANGWGNIKEITEKNSKLIGIDLSSVKDEMSVYSYMLTCSVNSISDIKNAFNDGLKKSIDLNGGSGGSGGSSGGSGGSSGNRGLSGNYSPINSTITGKDENNYYAIANFSDLTDAEWARQHIEKLSVLGVIEGMGDGTFMPHQNVTREAFVKMIVTAFDIYDENYSVSFYDVPSDAWYYSYVASAVKCGIINGIEEHNFGAGQPITRQDMAVIAYRASKTAGKHFDEIEEPLIFTDRENISDYAKKGVNVLSNSKIINGMGDGTFAPQGFATRAQAAVVISLLYDLS